MKQKLSKIPIVICCDRLEQQVDLTTQLAQEFDDIVACQLSKFEQMLEREPNANVVVCWKQICAEVNLIIDLCSRKKRPLVVLVESINSNDINRLPEKADYVLLLKEIPIRLSPWLEHAYQIRNTLAKLEQKIETLEIQLQDRKVIEKAKGLLMKLHHVDEDAAYKAMRKTAMQSSQSLAQVARNLLQTLEALQ